MLRPPARRAMIRSCAVVSAARDDYEDRRERQPICKASFKSMSWTDSNTTLATPFASARAYTFDGDTPGDDDKS